MRMPITAGAPANGPLTWTSCACATVANWAVRPSSATANVITEPFAFLITVASIRQLSLAVAILEGEGEEERDAHVRHHVVGQRGVLIRPRAGRFAIRAELDIEVLELLQVHVVAELAEDREVARDEHAQADADVERDPPIEIEGAYRRVHDR